MSGDDGGRLCVVTGGRGFAARHLIEMLIRLDKFLVRIADLAPAIELSPEEVDGDLARALESGRATYVSMDLRNKPQVVKALEGAEVVFHMAAPHSGINNYELHYSVNVQGTKNVIDACVELQVKILIYTSSASVVFDGIHPIHNGDESLPYPPKPLDSYSGTKAEAEAAVLKANGTNGLLTCSLRPSSIFGPGDKLFVPSLAENGKAGKSKSDTQVSKVKLVCFTLDFTFVSIPCFFCTLFHDGKWMVLTMLQQVICLHVLLPTYLTSVFFMMFSVTINEQFLIGDGNNIYDFTYVENVAHAHICAEHTLSSAKDIADKAAGQAYFITNMEPMKFWEFAGNVWEGLGYQSDVVCRPTVKVPAAVVLPIAYAIQWAYNILGPYGMKVPVLIPSRVRLLSGNRSFSCAKAHERLGYTPIVSLEEGLKRTLESFSHLSADNQPKREGPSKASLYLGNGRVAEALLWKDTRKSLAVLLVLIGIYYSFVLSDTTIITAISKLLLLTSILLFVHGRLPEKIFGYNIEKIRPSHFYCTEKKSYQVAHVLASIWNAGIDVLETLCKGNDWVLFVKVVSSLMIIGIIGTISLHSLFVIGVPLAFIGFYLYERNEEAIDGMVSDALSYGCKLKSQMMQKVSGPKKSN
ncbi:3beta-hydroxysteroid-dehydrogenase/decarboxylase isoform 2 [Linum grandiflorum]